MNPPTRGWWVQTVKSSAINLFVADGSVVPANLGVNPSLTITALSEYIMSQMPENKEMAPGYQDDAPAQA